MYVKRGGPNKEKKQREDLSLPKFSVVMFYRYPKRTLKYGKVLNDNDCKNSAVVNITSLRVILIITILVFFFFEERLLEPVSLLKQSSTKSGSIFLGY